MKLKEKKIYILPTKAGLLTVTVTFIGFIISLSFANPLAISCSLLFLTTLLLSSFLTHYQLVPFDQIFAPSEIFGYQNSTIPINFRIKSKRKNFASEMLSLSIPYTSSKSTFSIEENEVKNLTVSFFRKEVGISKIPNIILSSTFPFGLFKAWIIFPCSCQCYIAPSPIGIMPLPLFDAINSSELLAKSHVQNGDELYHEHRPYRQGDSWRRIDWIRHNNSNILLTKSYGNSRGESYRLVYIDLIDRGLNRSDSFHQLASWIDECHKRNLNYSLELQHLALGQAKGSDQWQKAIKMLARVAQEQVE